MTKPTVYMIAGPNGAGKTTAAMALLPDFLSIHEFVNADEIARGLNPLDPYGQPVAAGRVMLERIDELISEGKSFAFETTGASRVFAERLQKARDAGYRLGIIYLWLPNVETAKQRVALRVAQGGHNVPERDVERRFGRSLQNLIRLYLPLMDQVDLFDCRALEDSSRRVIAEKHGKKLQVYNSAIWRDIERIAAEGVDEEPR